MKTKNKHIGSDFDDFLREDGTLEVTEAVALKRVIAYQLAETMRSCHVTKAMMAKRMHTSRSAVDRLFDPENDSVTLTTLYKAAIAVGKKLKIELA